MDFEHNNTVFEAVFERPYFVLYKLNTGFITCGLACDCFPNSHMHDSKKVKVSTLFPHSQEKAAFWKSIPYMN